MHLAQLNVGRLVGEPDGPDVAEFMTAIPAMNLLAFLVQGQLEPQEVNYLVQAAVTEFQASPAAYLGQLRSLNGSIAQAQGISDPLKLGEFRYKLIGEFYAAISRARFMPAIDGRPSVAKSRLALSFPVEPALRTRTISAKAFAQVVNFNINVAARRPSHPARLTHI